jgi:hypothetical protein
MNTLLMLKIVARFPTLGKPTKILARRDFQSMADLKQTMDNIIARAKNVRIIYAGRISAVNGTVIDASEQFKRRAEVMVYRNVQTYR